MKFKVATMIDGRSVTESPVNWIKSFREATDLGLRDSKWVCDAVRAKLDAMPQFRTYVVIDTTVDTQLAYLNDLRTFSDQRLIQRIGGCGCDPENRTDPVTVLLERTAIRLIRMGAYEKSRDVLKILS